MAPRRAKKRVQAGPNAVKKGLQPDPSIPRSMVIRINASEVGSSVTQLVKDMRLVMAPHTAARLRERRNNKLRDYTTMAGPLGVSHMMLFSKSEAGNTNMRLCTTPRGPTLSFRVEKYSLCKDVQGALRRPRGKEEEDYLNPPLLLMNNIQQAGKAQDTDSSKTNPIPKQLEDLTTTVFRSLFPSIAPQTTPLHSVKRVLLLDRVTPSTSSTNNSTTDSDPTSAPFVLQLRHYAITTRRTGVSRTIKRLSSAHDLKHRKVPNLGKLSDVPEYLLDPSAAGFTSASETEIETDAEVEVLAATTRKVLDRKQRQKLAAQKGEQDAAQTDRNGAVAGHVEKRAVKLVELGPRMTLRLMKIEEGLAGGKVLWHERFTRTKQEEREMEAVWEQRRAEREERRKVQKENVERKKKEKAARGSRGEGEEDEDEDEEMQDWDEDMWDDDEAGGGVGLDDEEEDDEEN